MSTSRLLTIQSALKNITKTHQFSNHWTKVSSLELALKHRYKLHGINVSKFTISQSLSKANHDITSLSSSHPSGIYKTRYKGEAFYYFQDGSLPPPSVPTARDYESWNNLITKDDELTDSYLRMVNRSKSLSRSTKKRRLDNLSLIHI